ncbi:putative 7-deoxyloganetin glucosyltransferase [Medicago truncatula]|uniref:Putative 7-deoxyloganetin glucosyltransferase n=1 Tax=Medicago truncatula TaxID=3880 RepID=A0A396HFS6_MEDTR|nr:putative 7-deoxyloganetin glucosyltransferase [Medicago truncatula]
MFPSLYPIGPLPSLLNQTPQIHQLDSLGSNLWKEDTKCLEWLESKEPGSVVYVNFGSITVMTPKQLLEFAWGLANCNKPFLWIIRPDLVIGGSVVLSSEFVNEISDRGLIASWCPQEKVLNHPSIGGFLTHCGWNSTTESICAGVPMLCWPFFGDQPTNCRLIYNEWEIGMEIDTNVKREEVEKLVNELMSGEKGKKMRQKAIELKKKVEENTRAGGCSYMNLDKVIKERPHRFFTSVFSLFSYIRKISNMTNFEEKRPHAVLINSISSSRSYQCIVENSKTASPKRLSHKPLLTLNTITNVC